MIENQTINIKEELKWSNLFDWNDLISGKVNVPKTSGVYEVVSDSNDSLHIGMAGDLNKRIIKQLTGKGKHSTRKRIVENNVDLTKLKLRWAETKFPAAVEEYLHRKYKTKYSKIKKYLI